MSSHLIIGLGGTGGKIIRELRKRIYQEFRSTEPGNGVHIDYVYVDSSLDDLNNRSDWKVLGKSVHLGEAQKVDINGINASVLDNINQYPGLRAFMTDDDIRMIRSDRQMGEIIGSGIGGQRRRLGRLLMANNMANAGDRGNFENIVRAAVKRLQSDSGDENVTFHICAGLAGGTGSGSIIDAIAQLRTWYPYNARPQKYKMCLVTYLPEQALAYSDDDKGYYQANGYAALKEINALSVGEYKPVDVKGEMDIYTKKPKRLLENQEAFEACYIYTNINEHGKIKDLKTELPSIVADFLFQTIVVSEITGGKGKMGRLDSNENEGGAPEEDAAGIATRSRKFLTFGITRVSYPEAEVREFVTYSYARQAALQLTYNYWIDGKGYDERTLEEVGSGYREEIKNPKNRGRWLLDASHLMLSEPIIESTATKTWRTLDNTWSSRIAREVSDITNAEPDKKKWVNILSDRCKNFYEKDFRNVGVKAFYKNQREEINAYSTFIRRHIEQILFDEWVTGSRSALEIEKYVGYLIEDCIVRTKDCEDKRTQLANEELAKAEAEMKKQKIEYDNIGWLRDTITGASGKILGRYQTAIVDYYTTQTRVEAFSYSKELLEAIIIKLEEMKEGIQMFKKRISDIKNDVEEQAANKCKVNESQDETNIKRYDPQKVRDIVKQYTSNAKYQEESARQIRRKLVEQIGDTGEHTFSSLYAKVDKSTANDIILNVCTDRAISAMEETAKSSAINRMVGVNILEKLKDELTSDEKLEEFVRMTIRKSGAWIQFNKEEVNKGGVTMPSMVQLSIPKAGENTQAFRDKLIQAFRAQIKGEFSEKEDVSLNYNNNEIVCVSAYSGFPLRFVSNMTILRDKYNYLLADNKGDMHRLLLHTESFDKELPELFSLDANELRWMVFKPLMLAYTLGLIEEKENPETGEHFSAMKQKDQFDNDEWVKIGKTFAAALDYLSGDYAKAKGLMIQVENTLKTSARTNEQKATLKPILGNVLKNEVLNSLCNGNEFHPDFPRYKNLAVEILNKELKEL
jgi:hypothetical protein